MARNSYDEDERSPRELDFIKNVKRAVYGVVGFILLLILWVNFPLGIVGAGERGVLLQWGAVTGKIYGEGLYFRVPIWEKVKIMDVRVIKDQISASASSKDLQQVTTKIALNFHLDPTKAAAVYRDVGMEYKERIIDPAVPEATKAVMANFTAEQLITKREQVREDIKQLLFAKLAPHGVVIDESNMVDFDFSKSYNDAIEKKVTAEQNALASKNKLEQIKYEAQQKVEEARGKAEALKLESKAIEENPKVIELRLLEKWDGHYPQYVGGGMPLPMVDIQNRIGK
jgi:regulator of protease activity HflC (stomatin/prohibitin superfamily)